MSEPPADDRPEASPAHSHTVLVAALALSALSFAVMQSLVVPALPAIRTEYRLDGAEASWVLTATLVSSAVSTPLLGRLGDIRGRRTVLLCVLVVLALGVITAAASPCYAVLLVGRALQGLAGAVFPLAFGLIDDHLAARPATHGIGFVSSMSAAGLAIGVVAAAALVGSIGFRGVFWLSLVPVLAAVGLVAAFTPARPTAARGAPLGWSSAVLMAGWLGALLLAVAAVPTAGWLGPPVLGWSAVSAALAAAWLMVELRATAPLIDVRMFAAPALACANAVSVLLGVVMYSAFAFLPDFGAALAVGSGAAPSPATYLLPWAALSFLAGLASGPLTVRFGARATLSAGMAGTAVAFALLAMCHRTWQIASCSGLLGLGSGLATGVIASLVVAVAAPGRAGVASSVTTNSRLVGGALGTHLFATVVAMAAPAGHAPTAAAYQKGFVALAITAGIAGVTALAVPRPAASARPC